jgi:hypothetical protein
VNAPDDPAGWRPLLQGADEIFPTTYRDGDKSASAYIVRYRVGLHDKPITRMLSAIADPEIWQIADTGRVVPHEDVVAWVESWGRPHIVIPAKAGTHLSTALQSA